MSVAIDREEFFYVKTIVRPSETFKREGIDIFSKVDIGVSEALNGGTVEIKGLHQNRLKLTIPPGTSSHARLTLPGEGIRMPGLSGDHVVEIGINMESLSESDEELLRDHTESRVAEEVNDDEVLIPVVFERNFL